MQRARSRQGGFTYLGLLFAIVILGITLASVGVVWSTQVRRDREAELLFVGDQFRQAIGRYQESGGVYPHELDELVEDKRLPLARRYLRRVYADPMTGSADWELIKAPDGGIMGVASSSQQAPIKVARFRLADAAFADAKSYSAWKFIYVGKPAGRRRELPQLPSLIRSN
jgi:type II secretory pathway pseudopilin PulG